MIKEIIVVEGKDDVQAVKRAVEAELITTNGFALSKQTIKVIKEAQQRRGVIILTDPDYMGEQIRERINKAVPGCKHAFLPRDEATFQQDVGVENASPEAISIALKKARCQEEQRKNVFTHIDLLKNGLVGQENSQYRRVILGKILGIGYSNGKQLLSRLNNFGITREEFEKALMKMEN